MFTPPPQYPTPLPPDLAAAALLADRAERLLTNFFDTHPADKPELVIKASRAIWSLTAVRKTIYLLVNPGADRRHKRKPDATMTYIEHRVQELHDWVAEYQRLIFAMKRNPSQFVVTPSGGSPSETYHIQHIETVPSRAKNDSPQMESGLPTTQPATHNPQLLHAMDSSTDDNNAAANLHAPSHQEYQNSPSLSPSAPLRLCVENSSAPALSLSAPSASQRFNSPDSFPLPKQMNTTPPLRNPLGTALGAARATVAIATEANIPFDPINFFPAEIDPAAAIAGAHTRQSDPSSSSSSLVSSCLGGEKVTFRNRRVTLSGKPLPPNDLPQLPKLPAIPKNPRPSPQSENPCPPLLTNSPNPVDHFSPALLANLRPGATRKLRPPPP